MPEPPWGEAIKPGFPSMGCSGFFAAAGQVLSVLKNVFLAPGLQIVIELCWTGYALRSVRRLGRRAKRGNGLPTAAHITIGRPIQRMASGCRALKSGGPKLKDFVSWITRRSLGAAA